MMLRASQQIEHVHREVGGLGYEKKCNCSDSEDERGVRTTALEFPVSEFLSTGSKSYCKVLSLVFTIWSRSRVLCDRLKLNLRLLFWDGC